MPILWGRDCHPAMIDVHRDESEALRRMVHAQAEEIDRLSKKLRRLEQMNTNRNITRLRKEA